MAMPTKLLLLLRCELVFQHLESHSRRGQLTYKYHLWISITEEGRRNAGEDIYKHFASVPILFTLYCFIYYVNCTDNNKLNMFKPSIRHPGKFTAI